MAVEEFSSSCGTAFYMHIGNIARTKLCIEIRAEDHVFIISLYNRYQSPPLIILLQFLTPEKGLKGLCYRLYSYKIMFCPVKVILLYIFVIHAHMKVFYLQEQFYLA